MSEKHQTTSQEGDWPPIQVVGGTASADDLPVKTPRKGLGLVASLVTLVAVVSFGVLATRDDVRRPVIPDFSQDATLVGDALTAAYDPGDVDLYLSLLAADAELGFSAQLGYLGEKLSLSEYREFIVGWSQTMNERWEWVDCQRTGESPTAPVLCQVRITSDWLELIGEEPDRGRVTVHVVDGRITRWEYRGLRSPGDEALARFEDWTRQHRPDSAAVMWDADALIVPVFTEESARLHLRLAEEYVKQFPSVLIP